MWGKLKSKKEPQKETSISKSQFHNFIFYHKNLEPQDEIEADFSYQFQLKKVEVEKLLKVNNIDAALKVTIEKPPYEIQSDELVSQFVFLVHSVLNQISLEKADVNQQISQKYNIYDLQLFIAKLTKREQKQLFDYINKSFEYISEGKPISPFATKINGNYLLKFQAKFYENKPLTIIIQGLSGEKSLMKRKDKWESN